MKKPWTILLTLALLACLCGCQLRNRMPSELAIPTGDDAPKGTTVPETSQPAATAAKPQKQTGKAAVKEIFTRQGSYTDKNGRVWQYDYHIPYVDLDGAGAQRCNREIETNFQAAVNAAMLTMEELEPLSAVRITYEIYQNGSVLTLVVTRVNGQDQNLYGIYNLDADTGDAVDFSQILTQKELSESEFLDKTRTALGSLFESLYADQKQSEALAYETQYQRTVSGDNYGTDMPMYLDEEARLHVIATVYSVGGSGSETYDLVID